MDQDVDYEDDLALAIARVLVEDDDSPNNIQPAEVPRTSRFPEWNLPAAPPLLKGSAGNPDPAQINTSLTDPKSTTDGFRMNMEQPALLSHPIYANQRALATLPHHLEDAPPDSVYHKYNKMVETAEHVKTGKEKREEAQAKLDAEGNGEMWYSKCHNPEGKFLLQTGPKDTAWQEEWGLGAIALPPKCAAILGVGPRPALEPTRAESKAAKDEKRENAMSPAKDPGTTGYDEVGVGGYDHTIQAAKHDGKTSYGEASVGDYDPELFGEDDDGEFVAQHWELSRGMADEDVRIEIKSPDAFDEEVVTVNKVAAEATEKNADLSMPTVATSLAKKAPVTVASVAPTEHVIADVTAVEKVDTHSAVAENHRAQPDPELVKTYVDDIAQSLQKGVSKVGKLTGLKKPQRKGTGSYKAKPAKIGDSNVVDIHRREVDAVLGITMKDYFGLEVADAFSAHKVVDTSAKMIRYQYPDGTVECIISGVLASAREDAKKSDLKANPAMAPGVITEEFAGEKQIDEALEIYEKVNVTTVKMTVFEHLGGGIDIVLFGLVPTVVVGNDDKGVKEAVPNTPTSPPEVVTEIGPGNLPTPAHSSTTGSPDDKLISRKRKYGNYAEADTGKAKRKKVEAIGTKAKKANLETTKQNVATSSRIKHIEANVRKENDLVSKGGDMGSQIKEVLAVADVRALNKAAGYAAASSSYDSSDISEDVKENRPLRVRSQKPTTGAKRGFAARKANLIAANGDGGVASTSSKLIMKSIAGNKGSRVSVDDDGHDGDVFLPSHCEKRIKKA